MQEPKDGNLIATNDEETFDKDSDDPNKSAINKSTANEDTSEPKDRYEAYMSQVEKVPPALPQGWVVRYSRSQPGYQYYFHQDTGECKWDMPVAVQQVQRNSQNKLMIDTDSLLSAVIQQASNQENTSSNSNKDPKNTNLYTNPNSSATAVGATSKPAPTPAPAPAVPSGILKRKSAYSESNNVSTRPTATISPSVTTMSSSLRSSKRSRKDHPEKVRVLHLLKKHAKSRRPSSWRKKNITITKDEAISELQELIAILKEVEEDPKELRATFEELAKTESDCSSGKRGGDLGFFGKKKMQPAFEKASFALKVGQLSDIVETSSGVHVILRLG